MITVSSDMKQHKTKISAVWGLAPFKACHRLIEVGSEGEDAQEAFVSLLVAGDGSSARGADRSAGARRDRMRFDPA